MSKELGRSLEDLVNENEFSVTRKEEVVEIDIEDIHYNPEQPRKIFDQKSIEELGKSLQEHGLIQPIIVKKSGDHYMLVAGERRIRAAKNIGLNKVPAIIRDYNSKYLLELAILENIQREDLKPIEQALAFYNVLEDMNLTHQELAERIGKSRSYITNMIGLLSLPLRVIELLNQDLITVGHARALSKLKDHDLIMELAGKIISEQLTVRDIEDILRAESKKSNINKESIKLYKSKLNNYIDKDINYKLSRNSLTFKFDNKEQLDRIIQLLLEGRNDQ